jgi:osmotically-inducible protein OsmY
VPEVDNQLKVRLMDDVARVDADIRGDVLQALMLDGLVPKTVDAEGLHVSTDDGIVTIRGTVGSWAERDEAIDAAWSAPGVTMVRDDLTVTY